MILFALEIFLILSQHLSSVYKSLQSNKNVDSYYKLIFQNTLTLYKYISVQFKKLTISKNFCNDAIF